MSEKKVGKRLLTWVLVLVMALSLLPLNVLAAGGPETDSSSGMNFDKRLVDDKPDGDGNYTIRMTAQATGTTTTTTKVEPMDIVLVLDQSGSMADDFDNGTRQSAMKAAVNRFIGEVADKYSPNADHRMAIVTFDDDAKTLAGWTAVNSDGADALTSKISGLTDSPSGATNVGAGMQMAKNLMDSDAYTGGNTDRLKTVIVFTDGVPTTGTRFNVDVANRALEIAQNMKNDGVSIYTIGVFSGADIKQLYGKGCNGNEGDKWGEVGFLWFGDVADVDRPAGNRFLNYLSSNFKNANKIGLKDASWDIGLVHYDGWRITKNFDRDSSDYYLTASNASSLEKIFKKISTTVPAPGDPALDENTVITDTLSDYFTFATGTADGDVKVYAGQDELINGENITVNLNPTTKTVTVTGYDFSAHHTTSDAPKELVIEIKVKPSGEGYSSKDIPTNADTAGTHAARVEVKVKSEDGTGTETKVVTSHETAKVTGHQVIYDLDGGTGITNDDLYYAEGTSLMRTADTPVKTNCTFGGWKATGVTVNQDGSFTMPNKDVTFTAIWELDPATPAELDLTGYIVKQIDDTGDAFENDTTFTVNVAPVASGAGINGTATLKTGSANFIFADKLEISEDTTFNVSEDDGQIAGVEYDDTTYLLKVTTGLDTAANAVTIASVSYSDDNGASWHEIDGTVSGDKLVIINKYTKPASYNVVYNWGTLYPSDQTLPTNTNFYASEAEARAAKDTTFNRGYTSTAKNGEQEGTWTFSGWDNGKLSGTTITFTGSWTFTPEEIEPTYVDVTIKYYRDDLTGDPIGTDTTNAEVGSTITLNGAQLNAYKPDGYNNGVQQKPKPYPVQEENNVINVLYTKEIVPDTILGILNQYVWKQFNSTYGYSTSATFTVDATVTKIVPVINASEEQIATQDLPPVDSYTGTVTLSAGTSDLFVFSGTDTPLEANTYYQVTVKEREANLSYVTCDTKEHTFGFYIKDGKAQNVQGVTITNAYYYKPTYRPPTPTIVIPDDDALGLNTTDHFAYIVGYGNGEVRPQNNITRAEVATIFFRLLTDDVRDENLTKTNRYSDVAATSWYNTAVSTLSSMGIITGYPDGTFRPNAAITRAEFAAIAARFDNDGDKTAAKFSDIATHWAKDEISIAYNNGWITGYPDGTFGPQRDITRAETMTLVNRVLNRQPETEDDLLPNMTVWTDNANPKAWYYLAVQEATNSHYYEFKTNSKYEKWTELRETRDWTQLEK